MAANATSIASYLPRFVCRQVSQGITPGSQPPSTPRQSAILFVDISGFSSLTETLVGSGPEGVEQLSRILNDYFEKLTDHIDAQGGDVIRFAGDALVAQWLATDESAAVATLRAADCALKMLAALSDYQTAHGVRLQAKATVASGETIAASMGGVAGHWVVGVAGSAFLQLAAAAAHGDPGTVTLSPEAGELLSDAAESWKLPDGHLRLTKIRGTVPPVHSASLPPLEGVTRELRAYVPPHVLAKLDAGHEQWMAEFRRLTFLFCNVTGVSSAGDIAFDAVQDVIRAVQEILTRYDGNLQDFGLDDKGTTFMAVFGLSNTADEQHAVSGLRAAGAIDAAIEKAGLRCSIGVTTGRAYCGPIGASHRCHFTVYGTDVNIAARLMQVAGPGRVVCDDATRKEAVRLFEFDILPRFALKGSSEPIPAYRVRSSGQQRSAPMVGRREERDALRHALDNLIGGSPGRVVIEGEPGIGKSVLVRDLIAEARSRKLTTVVGHGDANERSTPYYAWRPIFQTLFRLDQGQDPEELRKRVHERLVRDQDNPDLAPLLNSILPLALPDNQFTSQMAGRVRADNTHELLVRILQKEARRGPVLAALEDGHWLDSASWDLAIRAAREVAPLLFVMATRPPSEPVPPQYNALTKMPGTDHWHLDVLRADDVRSLLLERLQVNFVSNALVDLVHNHTGGNPFFVEELSYSLRDNGRIAVIDGICDLADPAGSRSQLDLPGSIQELITKRIDRLDTSHQLTIKVASVIGRIFAVRTLSEIHPVPVDKGRLPELLGTLARLELTPLYAQMADLAYIFKHRITQEVAYNLLLFEQRRTLHRAIAEWHERYFGSDLSAYLPLLAHHWQRVLEHGGSEASALKKAVDYATRAGEQAIDMGAYKEAVGFLTKALELVESLATAVDEVSLVRLHRLAAEAYLGLGDHRRGREQLYRALALLGWPAPVGTRRVILNTVPQVLTQLWHRLIPIRRHDVSTPAGVRYIEGTRAYQRLMETYWFANETIPLIHAGLRSLNLAERASASPELARAYGVMAISAGSIPQHRLAHVYRRRALRTAGLVKQDQSEAYALFYPSVYAVGTAKWTQVENDLARAATLFERTGDKRLLGDTKTVLGMSALYQARFTEAIGWFTEVYTAGLRNDNFQHQVWALIGKAEAVFRLGQIGDAAQLLEAALAVLSRNPDKAEELRARGLLGVIRLRQGDLSRASREASAAFASISSLWVPTAHYLLEGYAGAVEVFLAMTEANQGPGDKEASGQFASAGRAEEHLRKFARIFSIGEPRAWLWRGSSNWIRGRRAAALSAWSRSLKVSQRLGMPYETALAHFELGRRLPIEGSERKSHLNSAAQIFEKLNAAGDLGRVKDQLGR